MSKNIVFFVHSLNSGGVENYLLRFLREKHTEFSNVFVYCKSGWSGQLEAEYSKIENVKVIKEKIDYLDVKVLYSLNIFLKKNKISSVCDFTGNFSGLTLLTARMAGMNKRIAFYRSSRNRFKSSIFRNSYNSILNHLVKKNATDILANSEAGLNHFFPNIWKYDSKFEVIYNGINASEFINSKNNLRYEFGIPDSAFVIGHTGRFNSAKNHTAILAVAEKIVKEYDDIYFIMCGNGVKNNLGLDLKSKNLASKILVFENRSDIPEFLNTMDCYFFPSITEGQPNALIEAMIMGLPYVASNIESIKEITINSDGLYSPDDIDSFIKDLIFIYKNRPDKDISLQKKYINKFDHHVNFDKFCSRIFKI